MMAERTRQQSAKVSWVNFETYSKKQGVTKAGPGNHGSPALANNCPLCTIRFACK